MTGIEVVGVVLAIPGLIEICRHTMIAIQDVSVHLNYARLASRLLLPVQRLAPAGFCHNLSD